MRRLLAAAALAAAFAAPAPAAVAYDFRCGGVLDTRCNGTVCAIDCVTHECLVWVDPFHTPYRAVCV